MNWADDLMVPTDDNYREMSDVSTKMMLSANDELISLVLISEDAFNTLYHHIQREKGLVEG